jgi:catechol 2,3-dioxygenase
MHLHVADLDQAVYFYTRVLGFDFIMDYMGSAAFLSAGGYHHHIGLNTWNGIGAPPNPVRAAGLKYFTINLQGEGERVALVERLEKSGWRYDEQDAGILVRDPSGNGILLEIVS